MIVIERALSSSTSTVSPSHPLLSSLFNTLTPTQLTPMTRGRKRTLTTAPSRQLAHQRAYRDRKAAYVADLETRLKALDDENAKLRIEVGELRSVLEAVGAASVMTGIGISTSTTCGAGALENWNCKHNSTTCSTSGQDKLVSRY